MKVALRALSISLILLWLFVSMLLITVLYSAIRIEIGQVSTETEPTETGARLIIDVPIHNRGFHDITDLELSIDVVVELTGDVIMSSTSYVPIIRKGEEGHLVHVIELNLTEIAENERACRALVLNDTNLIMIARISLTYAYMFRAEIEANSTSPWGAPMSGLTVSLELPGPGEGELVAILSFENHASFSYSFQLEAFNHLGDSLGSSGTTDVYANSTFDGLAISIPVDTALWTGSGYVLAHLFIGSAILTLEVARF
ncbi:MAG TPA: hypothetical protein ENF78_05280 [Candidatus Bathyarchaeota archaeon]|nr:hypothetical protein [Candidatus Bathyarchaeota archaeon]